MDQVVIASSGSSADARQREPSVHIPFTKQAKKALELSMRESIQLGAGLVKCSSTMRTERRR